MKQLLLPVLLTASVFSAEAQTVRNFSGSYEAKDGETTVFQVELKETSAPGSSLKDIEFQSALVGTCSNINTLGGRAQYGYFVVTNDSETFTRISAAKVDRVVSTIFCEKNGKKNWYNLVIEAAAGELGGKTATIAYYLQDASLDIVTEYVGLELERLK